MIRDLKQLICDPERVIPGEALEDKYLSDTLNHAPGGGHQSGGLDRSRRRYYTGPEPDEPDSGD